MRRLCNSSSLNLREGPVSAWLLSIRCREQLVDRGFPFTAWFLRYQGSKRRFALPR
jgi:hypothetical protein